MKKIILFMVVVFLTGVVTDVLAQTNAPRKRYPIMPVDRGTLNRWNFYREKAPKARTGKAMVRYPTSLSLLSHLSYVASERDQGYCGDCWLWAGTGVIEIALDVNLGIKDRLSIQFACACYSPYISENCGCEGGWLEDVSAFYSTTGMAIPWSNVNAFWQNADGLCNNSCSDIGTTPNYPITTSSVVTIETVGVGQSTAINNIKSVLNQNKAVYFSYCIPTGDGWDQFFNFWDYQSEDAIWDPSSVCGTTFDSGGGCHAVLCVGYSDESPTNRYWILLNSWGTASGGRPNGLFRCKMNIDYDCQGYWLGVPEYLLSMQTLDITFGDDTRPPVTTVSATSVSSNTATVNGTVNPNGHSTTYYFQYGRDSFYGQTTPGTSAGSGTNAVAANYSLTDLIPGSTYHFRIYAINSCGAAYGSNLTFRTEGEAPHNSFPWLLELLLQ